MSIAGKARHFEATIARTLTRAAKDLIGPTANAREPLELVHAVIDRVAAEIQPGGRGTRVFPFNRIALTVLAPSAESRARFDAIFDTPPTLRDRIVERLAASRCREANIAIDFEFVTAPAADWTEPDFHIAFARVTAPLGDQPTRRITDGRRIELTVVCGVAEQREYSISAGRVDIGRCREVRDSRNRLIRSNHVAFLEASEDVNQTISRQHAHIVCDAASGEVRIYDDGSVHGTGIVRSGRTLPVPRGDRGVRLQPGDEIVLGEARLRVTF